MNHETKWPDDAPESSKPAKQKIDWGKVHQVTGIPANIKDSGEVSLPTGWIAWNCDKHTRGNPLPDGLVVEWYHQTGSKHISAPSFMPNWASVTRFRIVGVQPGWK